jgi:type IV secretory pathway TraG/TraD family ATPase VirD4
MTRESFAREFAYTILVNLNPQMISKPDFWTDNATSLLASTFWYLREKCPNYCTLPHAISMILQPNYEALLRELSSLPKCGEMIAPIMTAYQQGADNQLAGVISSLQISLSKINFDEVYYLMSESEVSLQLNDPEKKGILTVGNNPQLSSTYAPLIGLILTSVSKQLNRAGKEKSVFMIDEFPTVYIPNVEQLPATARSNKVATILACQDIAQLTDKYGREKSETILSNLGNQFYGRTPNPATAKRVSELFGKEEQVVMSESKKNWDFDNDRTTTTSTRETDIVKAQYVANLDTGSFFTILSEGGIRQGISHIPMDNKFNKSEILPFSSADENDVKQAYKRVSLDVTEVILKQSILATTK